MKVLCFSRPAERTKGAGYWRYTGEAESYLHCLARRRALFREYAKGNEMLRLARIY
ncbi:MAG: hypothetical protein ACREXK_01895 [Gammaproteobacteria bacterium]